MRALSPLFLITEVAPSSLGVAIILLYITVPESSAQSIIKLGVGPVVINTVRYKESTVAL